MDTSLLLRLVADGSGGPGGPFVVFAGAGGCGEGEVGFGLGGVAGAGALPGADDQDHGVVERAAPGVGFPPG